MNAKCWKKTGKLLAAEDRKKQYKTYKWRRQIQKVMPVPDSGKQLKKARYQYTGE